MPNAATNVSQSKPKVGGAVYAAPIGTALPNDASTELNKDFECMGYVSEDGVTNSLGTENSSVKAWGGDVVLNTMTSKTDDWKLKFIESLNIPVLKTVFGKDNVTGDLTSGLTIKSTSSQPQSQSYVIDTIMRGNVLKRIVIPSGTLSSIGDVVYKDSDPLGYDLTISCEPDEQGVTHYEYVTGPDSSKSLEKADAS